MLRSKAELSSVGGVNREEGARGGVFIGLLLADENVDDLCIPAGTGIGTF